MYTILFESPDKHEVKVDRVNGEWFINGANTSVDIHTINPNYYNLIIDGKTYNLEILSNGSLAGSNLLKVNGAPVSAEVQTSLDELLNRMGMSQRFKAAIKDIKAPMPGLILKILVKNQMTIKKGDPILILEAMKMENVIKSPIDGIIKSLKVKEQDSVAKNQVLIEF